MALTRYTTPTNIIGTLGTDPEDRTDLDDQGLKDKFDKNADNIVAYINGSFIPEIEKVNIVSVTVSKTLELTDAFTLQICAHASVAINITVPPNSSVAFPVGTQIAIKMGGAAQVAVVAGSGVTINPSTKLKINAQYESAVLVKEATDTWGWFGSIKV
jgi:hypothetical protein